MKYVIIISLILLIVTASALGLFLYQQRQQAASTSIPAIGPNPLTTPSTSFGQMKTSPSTNPFVSPTPTAYQNPFSTTSTGQQSYQNPFEKLR